MGEIPFGPNIFNKNLLLNMFKIQLLLIITNIFAKCAVATAGHIGQNSIVHYIGAIGGIGPEIRHRTRILIHNHEIGTLEPLELMHEHVAAFIVQIVRNYEALRRRIRLVVMQKLNELRCLGAGRGAHVQYFMMRLHVQKQWRYHAHRLLTIQIAILGLVHEKLLKLFKVSVFSHVRTGQHDLPRHFVRVP